MSGGGFFWVSGFGCVRPRRSPVLSCRARRVPAQVLGWRGDQIQWPQSAVFWVNQRVRGAIFEKMRQDQDRKDNERKVVGILLGCAAAVLPGAALVWLWLSTFLEPTGLQAGVVFPIVGLGGPFLGHYVYQKVTRTAPANQIGNQAQ